MKGIISDRSESAKKDADDFPDDVGVFATHMTKCFLSPVYDTKTRWKIVKKMLVFLEYDSVEQNTLHDFARDDDGDFRSLNSIRNDYAHKTLVRLSKTNTMRESA